jgi:DNA-binding NtrC family response regulator
MLLAHSHRLLLAIIDVTLRDMSGESLARRLKEVDPELPVLMTSGDYAPELEAAARRVGILYYAHKPADYTVIGGVVDKALSN